ncbi:hypothetical protein D9V41_13905 [Aeromicrobium phragmitis]|uniref:Uncharacterized protein n=1 Tax=Aeromicrobium phragmitis TaxID=2478914 RepID=A0A3L8PJY9_9ACTN|nr:hypothetical protein D9V41_13905 [Aeromicrobium phragmitis]
MPSRAEIAVRVGALELLMSKNDAFTAATAWLARANSLTVEVCVTVPASTTSMLSVGVVRSAVSTLPSFQPSSSRREKLVRSRPGATRSVTAERRTDPSAPNWSSLGAACTATPGATSATRRAKRTAAREACRREDEEREVR